MSRPDQVVVHKDKGSRVFNVGMHLLPTVSVVPMAAARVLYGPLNPATYLTLALMGAGTLLPATGTLAELKEKLSSRGKQGVLTLSNLAMLSAVGLMMFGTIPALKESDPAKIAFSGMVLFGLASLLEIPYRAARALNLIGSKLPLELAAVASACVGSCLFLAAQVVAYAQARRTNNQDQMNTAILFALTSLGFIASTGYGAVQIFKAMKGNAVNPESTHAEVREEEGTTPTAPRLPKASVLLLDCQKHQDLILVFALLDRLMILNSGRC